MLHDTDLIAIGGVGAFAASIVLSVLAFAQVNTMRNQAALAKEASNQQVQAITETTAKELEVVRQQVAASVAQNEAVRSAARAQLQPIVFAHGMSSGDRDAAGNKRFQYYLANEGVGPALDVEHGIKLSGREYPFGGGDSAMRVRTLAAGEIEPPGFPQAVSNQLGPYGVDAPFDGQGVTYWTRFSNVFGDRFEVLNPDVPTTPAVFRPVVV